MKLHLAPGVTLPLDIVTMRSLVLGVSGSGKSTFGRLLAEKIHEAGQRFCVIDLKNDWWGLKASADGKSPAIPVVIIGGPRADVPLDENAGAAVADIVAETSHSFIIDLDELSKGKGIRFLGTFLERLYEVNRDPLLLICDEADRYAPQKPMSVEAHITLGAADDIARRGRKRGIGSLWLSQRPAVIAKNVTSQCELVVTFRTTSSLDLKELKDHIGRVASADQVTETMNRVAGLADGQGILMSQHPHTRMFTTAQFPMPATFDSSATPRVGHRRIEPKQLAAPDLAALDQRIQAAVEKARAEDPRLLKARVKELQLELAKVIATPMVERIEIPVLGANDIVKLRSVVSDLDACGQRACEQSVKILAAIETAASYSRAMPPLTPRREAQKIANRLTLPGRVETNGKAHALPKGIRAILTAIAQHEGGVTREQLTVLTGYKRSSRDTYLQKLMSEKLIYQRGEQILATSDGTDALGGDFEPLPTGDALREHWMQRLPEGERRILEQIVFAYPRTAMRDELSEVTGYKRSSRDTYLQKLAARRLIVSNRDGVIASDQLFG